MFLEGLVGPQTPADGAPARPRLDHYGALVVQEAYAEAVSRGEVFTASMQAAAALGTALTATGVTLTLYNPVGSGVNLAILWVSLAITSPPAGAAAYVYAASMSLNGAAPTSVTEATIRNALLGSGRGASGRAYTAATLGATAPVVIRSLASVLATGSVSHAPALDRVNEEIMIAPGYAVTIQGLTTASNGIVSMGWRERPL